MRILLLLGVLCFVSHLNALTLNEAINLALKFNPSLNQNIIGKKIQEKKTAQFIASQFGEFNYINSITKYDSPRVLQPITFKYRARDILYTGIEYKVPLFTGFELTENIKISKLNENLQNFSIKLTKNQLIFNIKSIYFKILSLKHQLEAMKEYKKSLKLLYQNVSLMVKTGKKPEVDLLKVDYDLKNVEALIEQIENNINTLKSALKEIIGKEDLKIDKIQEVKLHKNFIPALPDMNKITSIKLENLKTEIAKENVKKAKSLLYPQITLNSNVFEIYGNGNDVNTYEVTLNLKFNIFDFGKRRKIIEEAKLQKEKTALEKLKIRLKKEKEINEAINKIKTEKAKIISYKKQINFAKEEERIEKLKYEHGTSQIYDYLYAKSRRFIAESKYYNALYNHELAIAYYEYIIEKWAK